MPHYLPDLVSFVGKQLQQREQKPFGAPYPSAEQLGEFISVAYAVSMETEEGRRLKFSVLLSPNYSKLNYKPVYGVPPILNAFIRLDNPKPYNARELRKIAPVASIRSTHVVVEARDSEEGTRLEIVGLIDLSQSRFESRVGERNGCTVSEGIEVVVQGPGWISVCDDGRVVATLEKTEVYAPSMFGSAITDAIETFDDLAAFEAIVETIRNLCEAKKEVYGLKWMSSRSADSLPGGTYAPIFGALDQLVAKIQLARHGGLIFLLSTTDAGGLVSDDPRKPLAIKYSVHDERLRSCLHWQAACQMAAYVAECRSAYGLLREIGVDFEEWRKDAITPQLIDSAVARAVDLIAGLAQVDGGIVLDTGFHLHGFGAEMKNRPEDAVESVWMVGERRSSPDQSSETRVGTEVSIDEFGTRHRAAARFCRAFPNGIAIAVSQDGSSRVARNLSTVTNRSTGETTRNVVAFFEHTPLGEYQGTS